MKKSFWFACLGLIMGMAVTQGGLLSGASATSQTAAPGGQKKCDYTYIQDARLPNIGQNGEIKYDDSWATVLEDGWTLKATAGGSEST